jgi:cytochrome c biogenesis protein
LLLRFFTSIRTVLSLLGLTAVLSVLASVIPQGLSAGRYAEYFGPSVAGLLVFAGLDSVFTSWPFLAVCGLLGISLAVCTWRRMRSAAAAWRSRDLAGIQPRTVVTPLAEREARSMIRARCAELGLSRNLIEERGTIIVRSSVPAVFGSGVLHIGLILAFAGALLTGLAGHSALLRLPELRWADLPMGKGRVYLKKFTAEFYSGYNLPKSYTSEVLVALPTGRTQAGLIKVNGSLTVDGLQLSQSGYGVSPELREAVIEATAPGQQGVRFALPPGVRQEFEGGGTVRFDEYYPDYRMTNGARSSVSPEHRNPALVLVVETRGAAEELLLRYNDPAGTELGRTGVRFRFVSGTPAFYSDIRATSDPGFGVILAGTALIFAGLVTTFFIEPVVWGFRFFPESAPPHGTRIDISAVLAGRRGPRNTALENLVADLQGGRT